MRNKTGQRKLRHKRIRAKVKGTSARPRLFVFRSNKYIYATLIDDDKGETLGTAQGGKAAGKAIEVGKMIAEKAKKLKIKKVVFDRGGYVYYGRVEAVAKGARDGGLEF